MGLHRDGRLGLVEEELALPRAARRKVEVTARLHTEARGGVLGEVLAQLGPAARVKGLLAELVGGHVPRSRGGGARRRVARGGATGRRARIAREDEA